MRTRPDSGDPPSAASWVWLALDPYEIRSYTRIVASLRATRQAQVGPGWKHPKASVEQIERANRRVTKWADVMTTRGLHWLEQHGKVTKLHGGYLRRPPGARTGGAPLLDLMVEVEQRLRGIRTVWQNNPEFPRQDLPEVFQEQWASDIRTLLRQLGAVSQGIRTKVRPLGRGNRGAVSGARGRR